jgi:hypothetical protein
MDEIEKEEILFCGICNGTMQREIDRLKER